jgi:sugar O-acyltransferase (sialic acid O-acetyltransferase NeuD family)
MNIIMIGATKKALLILDFLLQEGREHEIVGIVDRDSRHHGTMFGGKPVLGTLESVLVSEERSRYTFCLALSERYFLDRARIAVQLSALACEIRSIVSSTATISSSATVAGGIILFPSASVGANARVGQCVTAYTGVLIEHDCVIENNVEIASRAVLAGGVKVKANSFIGINATVLPNLTIGENAIVGGGAVVTHDVESNAVVAGNPARVIRRNIL